MDAWKKRLKRDPTDWLLGRDNPSVRYLALRELLGRPSVDRDVVEAKAAIMRVGVVPRTLAKQQAWRGWGTEDRFYTDKYRGTVWQLLILAEHHADGDDERIQAACEFILRQSQDRQTHGFSTGEPLAKARAGDSPGPDTWIVPCLTGNLTWALLRFGKLADPRVARAIAHMVKYQRFDDGSAVLPKRWPYDRFDNCYGKHTCHMGVAKTLKAWVWGAKAVEGTVFVIRQSGLPWPFAALALVRPTGDLFVPEVLVIRQIRPAGGLADGRATGGEGEVLARSVGEARFGPGDARGKPGGAGARLRNQGRSKCLDFCCRSAHPSALTGCAVCSGQPIRSIVSRLWQVPLLGSRPNRNRLRRQRPKMGKRLYVGNLSYSVTETDLRDVFTEGGNEVTEVKMVLDRDTGRPRGFAFVEMATDAGAQKAIETLNGKDLQGRALNVSEALERGGRSGGGGGFGGGRGGGGGGGDRGGRRPRW